MSNDVGIPNGVLTPSSSEEEDERARFVRENPGYGYGAVNSTTNITSPASSTNSNTGSTSTDRRENGGSSTHAVALAAAPERNIDLIRQRDFPRLLGPTALSSTALAGKPVDNQQHRHHQGQPRSIDPSKREGTLVYLDHAGATLFGASQLRKAMESLLGGVQGNPHSQGPVSTATATRLDFARHSVLRYLCASPQEWSVVFTSGATAALKTLGEQFPWRPGGAFVHARVSHNSVLGIREYARAGGADVECLDLEDCAWLTSKGNAAAPQSPRAYYRSSLNHDGADYNHGSSTLENRADGGNGSDAGDLAGVTDDASDNEDRRQTVDCLFAFPAECNATGARLDLGIASRVKRGALSSGQRLAQGSRCGRPDQDRFSRDSSGWRDGEFGSKQRGFGGKGRDGTRNRREEGRVGNGTPWAVATELLPVDTRRKEQWWVLLDAAKFAGTAPLDLSKVEADFVAISFYKIFGYPTGLGALIIRESAARILRKRYFGGGTVLTALAGSPFRRFRPETERRLTDGTEHFLGVLALEAGFGTLNSLGGMGAIAAHTSCLARYLHARLSSMRHENGDPVVRIFGRWGSERSTPSKRKDAWATFEARLGDGVSGSNRGGSGGGQGPVLAMCFLRPGGDFVGHVEVEKMAEVENIQLRTGCFCNPGACQRALGLKDRDVKEHLERGHVCWDEHDLIDGRPTGLVRVSLGWMSTWEDVNAFASFVSRHFVVGRPLEAGPVSLSANSQRGEVRGFESEASESKNHSQHNRALLEAIYIYPIKSCAPQRAGASLLRWRPVEPSSAILPMESVTSTPSDEITENGGVCTGTNGRAGWPLGPSGLAYDREWALVDHRNRALRLKQVSTMCKIRPFVDLRGGTLTVSAPGMPNLVLPLNWGSSRNGPVTRDAENEDNIGAPRLFGGRTGGGGGETRGVDIPMIVRVCGNRRAGVACAASASAWFTRFLGVPCSLVRATAVEVSPSSVAANDGSNASAENMRGKRRPNGTSGAGAERPARGKPRVKALTPTPNHDGAVAERAFANEAQYLLISRASVDKVNEVIRESFFMADGRLAMGGSDDGGKGRTPEKVTTAHFRPNFVVGGVRAHEEDGWRSVSFGGSLRFRVTGPCSRCSMININPETGDTSGVALKVLASYRRERANIVFGQFLASEGTVSHQPTVGVLKPGLGDVVSASLGWKAWVDEGMEVWGLG